MGIRDRFAAGLARQLGRPEGLRGRWVARGLNVGNHADIAAAVAASGVAAGHAAADIGFGGGVGLRLLLERVDPGGHVHGVEISRTMLERARKEYAAALAGNTLSLHAGSLTALPLPDSSLDSLISTNTIYFVEDVNRAFAEIARVLKPGGRAAIGSADPALMAELPFTQYGFRIRPIEEVVALLDEAGLGLLEDRRVGRGEKAFHLLVVARNA